MNLKAGQTLQHYRGRVQAADSEEYIDPDRLSLILDWQAD